MAKRSSFYGQLVLFLSETIILNLFLKLIVFSETKGVFDPFGNDMSLMYFFNLAWLASVLFNRTYRLRNIERIGNSIVSILKTLGLQMFMTLMYVVFVNNFYFPKSLLYETYMWLLLSFLALRVVHRFWMEYLNPNFQSSKNVVVLGGGPIAGELKSFFDTQKILGYKFKGFFSHEKEESDTYVNELQTFCKN
ncbi:MAG: nucleoside-diphosphate sugar epimerase/dehydratase, partial [Flavobacteriales bacterium]